MMKTVLIILYVLFGSIYKAWLQPKGFVDLLMRQVLDVFQYMRRLAKSSSDAIKLMIIISCIGLTIIYVIASITLWPATVIEQMLTYKNSKTDETQSTTY